MQHRRLRADDEEVHEGRYNSPLTETVQAKALARAWQSQADRVQFDCIIASTMQRARTTAEIVGPVLGALVESDAGWTERDNGPLAEGHSRDEARRLIAYVVSCEILDVLEFHRPFDEARFFAASQRLSEID